ncbi:MAG: hypothetical protein JWN24_1778 [Phycisphaerales bacterium]|nr:hypothetical protein [Phycisphaerales bacterium]
MGPLLTPKVPQALPTWYSIVWRFAMPSPFPGMDPYLENPALWPDVHTRLINVASEFLLAALRPKYFVQIDERLYVADEFDEARSVIVPDIHIREIESSESGTARGGVAIEPGIELEPASRLEIHESRIEIVDREQQRVVTVVEILSPANKVKGSAGHKSYDEKKREVLSSETNLVEIDLLRAGSPIVSRPGIQFDYVAQVWRWTGRNHRRWVWPMRMAQRLKTIPIPVRRGDADAALDLQSVLNTAYDRAGYDLRVDYQVEPIPPLRDENAEWARQIVAGSRQS